LREFTARKRTATVGVRLGRTPRVGSISAGSLRPSGVKVGGGGISTPSLRAGGASTGTLKAKDIRTGSGVAVPYYRKADGGPIDYLASGGVGGMHPGSPRGTDTVP